MKPESRVSKKESKAELLARRIIEHNSRVVLAPHDDGSENGMVDYRVHRKEITAEGVPEQLGVLEVGTFTNPEFRSSYSQYTKQNGGFDSPTLANSWRVICEFGVVFRGLEGRLTLLLQKLEEQSLEKLRFARSDANAAKFLEEIATLPGVVEVMQIPDGQMSTQVVVTFMWSTTGTTNPEVTLEIVEKFLSSDDKDPVGIRKKVMSEPKLPYHGIYLYIDGAPELVQDTQFTEYRQFATPLELDVLPSRDPDLPHGSTDLWLIGKFGRGWHWNHDRGWTAVASPPAAEA